jgi:pimeloyl-ACP methyl ester carboxylesterase
VAGIEVFIRKGDTDNCLFMLHGVGSDHSSFDKLAEHLPKDIELISWNAPGYGNSAPLDCSQPVAKHYADKLREIVVSLGIKRIHLLGHSLGTLIAIEYVKHYPEDVVVLILLSCAQGYSIKTGSTLPEHAAQRLADLDAKGSLLFAQERAPRLLYQPDKKPELTGAAIDAMSRINRAGYEQAVYLLSSGNLKAAAANVSIPSLIIAASEDVITPPKQSIDCHKALSLASDGLKHTFVEIPDSGHLVHQEAPVHVAAHIRDFCAWGAGLATEQMT